MPVELTEPLVWRFGDWSPPPGLEAIEGTPLAWNPDHGTATSLLIDQFRTKERIVLLLRCFLAGVTDLDDAIWQCLTERWLDTSIGVQLDRLGWIVDLPRLGWEDETYRLLLKVQILTLKARGNWPDTFAIVARAGFDVSLCRKWEPRVAAKILYLGEPFADDVTAELLFGFLARATPAGVRFTLEAPTVDDSMSLYWADGDVEQADADRGWGDDAGTTGGVMERELANSEVA